MKCSRRWPASGTSSVVLLVPPAPHPPPAPPPTTIVHNWCKFSFGRVVTVVLLEYLLCPLCLVILWSGIHCCVFCCAREAGTILLLLGYSAVCVCVCVQTLCRVFVSNRLKNWHARSLLEV